MSLRGEAGWILPLGVIGCVLPAAGTEQSTTAASELARCASIAAATERLTCYDAHVCAVIPGAEERLACYDALTPPTASQPTGAQPGSPPAAGTAPATPPAAPPPPLGAAPPDDKSFGLTPHREPPSASGVTSIAAVVINVSEDRLGYLAVSLDNGQIWAVNELGAALRAGDAVTIKRGALGSFLMKTPARRSYHARRIQ